MISELGMTIIFWILFFVSSVFYVFALINQAKNKRWAWFVLTLIIHPLWLVYWIVRAIKND